MLSYYFNCFLPYYNKYKPVCSPPEKRLSTADLKEQNWNWSNFEIYITQKVGENEYTVWHSIYLFLDAPKQKINKKESTSTLVSPIKG